MPPSKAAAAELSGQELLAYYKARVGEIALTRIVVPTTPFPVGKKSIL